LTLLGRNYLKLGKIPEATENLEKGLQLKYEFGSTLDIAISQYDLGHAYHYLKDWGRAESLFSEALERIVGTGDIRHRANAMFYYALLKIDQDDFISARKMLEDARLIYQELQRVNNVIEIDEKLRKLI
jgi:tetratricopeptide (TPR) repeat protein